MKVLSAVDYHLEVYQEFSEGHIMGGTFGAPGMKRIEGSVRGEHRFASGQVLKLVTKEGLRLDFSMLGSDGSITAAGPLLDRFGNPVV